MEDIRVIRFSWSGKIGIDGRETRLDERWPILCDGCRTEYNGVFGNIEPECPDGDNLMDYWRFSDITEPAYDSGHEYHSDSESVSPTC